MNHLKYILPLVLVFSLIGCSAPEQEEDVCTTYVLMPESYGIKANDPVLNSKIDTVGKVTNVEFLEDDKALVSMRLKEIMEYNFDLEIILSNIFTNQKVFLYREDGTTCRCGDTIEIVYSEVSVEESVISYNVVEEKKRLLEKLKKTKSFQDMLDNNLVADSLFGECIHYWLSETPENDMLSISTDSLAMNKAFHKRFFSYKILRTIADELENRVSSEDSSRMDYINKDMINFPISEDPDAEFGTGCCYWFKYIPNEGYKFAGLSAF